ncbi:hypothetical protein G7Z12_22510 [Streptomyces sp. ID38640]|uniref:hypothetical protein n=1 Tax=Streptomyces sp. ID38640 TaxID=1265399 RepID=UPI00140E9D18|nr:hypothetical protein [Streptomyces sp. ID38640]QIK08384.1 hypothetical protein G7Z12_22510 [Streptomyces sp. ID38640]
MSTTASDLYLARRNAYAEFLSAADSEASVCWRKADGQYGGPEETTAAQDAAYTVTRDRYNRILVEPVGPHKEAQALIEQIRLLGRATKEEQDWISFKKAREVFVDAARVCLKDTLDG